MLPMIKQVTESKLILFPDFRMQQSHQSLTVTGAVFKDPAASLAMSLAYTQPTTLQLQGCLANPRHRRDRARQLLRRR